jgi:hypothetical protein
MLVNPVAYLSVEIRLTDLDVISRLPGQGIFFSQEVNETAFQCDRHVP